MDNAHPQHDRRSTKRKVEMDDYDQQDVKDRTRASDISTTLTPHTLKSSTGIRSAFKSPLKNNSLLTSDLNGSVVNKPSKLVITSSPVRSDHVGLLRQVGGLSRPNAGAGRTVQVDLTQKFEALRKREAEVDSEIAMLESTGLDEKDLRRFMDQLHDYNELKDAAQATFGRLANIRQCMIREIYEDLGLELED